MEELYEKLEAYLNGELSAEAREALEKQLKADPSLAEELSLFEEVKRTIQKRIAQEKDEADFLALIGQSNAGLPVSEGEIRNFRRQNLFMISVAAAVVLVLVGIYFFGNREKSGPDLYAMYAEAPQLPNVRDTEGGDCQKGALALESEAFEEAVIFLEKCLEDSTQGLDVQLALAYAYINVDEVNAQPLLEQIDAQRNAFLPAMKYRAAWYLILMGVKLEDWPRANELLEALLQNEDLPEVQRSQAQELKAAIVERF